MPGLTPQTGDVFGAIADHRHCAPLQRGKYQFSFFALWQGFQRLRVYDFRQKMIFIDVKTILFGSVVSHAGTAQLGQAVCFLCLYAHAFLDFMAHGNRPGFGTEYTDAQRKLADIDFHFFSALGNRQGIGWRRKQYG